MTGRPSVTVAIPTRDRVDLLATTLRSVHEQEGVQLDVVIVDDGSTPACAARIRAMAGGPVRVLRNETSRGVAAARNQGVEAGRGVYAAVVDDDDLWTPTKILSQVRAVEAADASWGYTGAAKFAEGPILWQVMPPPEPEEAVRRLPHKNVIPAGASNVLAHRETFLALGGFDPGLRHLADWDMWLRLAAADPPAAAPGLRVAYRLHPQAMSLQPEGILSEHSVIDRRWRHLRDGEPLDAGRMHLWIAMSRLRAGERAGAAASYLRAARTRPREGLRGALRTLHPRPPSPSHTASGLGEATAGGSAQVVTVPDELRATLHRFAASAP